MSSEINRNLGFEQISSEKKSNIEKVRDMKQEALANRHRDITEAVADTGASLMGGFANLARTGVGLVDILGADTSSVQGAYDVTGDAADFWDDSKSEVLKARTARADANVAERFKEDAIKSEQLIQNGWNPTLVGLRDQAIQMGYYLEEGISNPSIIFDQAAQSTPEFLLSGVLGKAMSKIPLRNMDAGTAQKFMASKAGQDTMNRIAVISGVGNTVVMEGMSNAIDAKQEVLNMKLPDLLGNSEDYRDLLSEGYSPKEAKEILADSVFNQTALKTGLFAGLTSKLTGAGKREGGLLLDSKGKGQRVKEVSKSTAAEGLEEALQGAGGTILSNIEVSRADERKEILEGAGKAAAFGTLTGGLIGGVASTAKEGTEAVVEGAVKTQQAIQEGVDKATKQAEAQTTVDKAVEENGLDEVISKAGEEFSVEAVTVATKKALNQKDLTSEDKADIYLKSKGAIQKFEQDALTKNEAGSLSDEATQEALNQADEAYKILDTARAEVTKETRLNTQEVESVVKEPTSSNVDRVLGSISIDPQSVTAEQTSRILGSQDLTNDQREQLELHQKTEDAIQQVEEAQGTAKVHKDIIKGSKGFKGIRSYQDDVNFQLVEGNFDKAKKVNQSFTNWADRQIERAVKIQEAFKPFAEGRTELTEQEQQNIDDVKANYDGFQVHVNSNKTGNIDTIAKEQAALEAAKAQIADRIQRAERAIGARQVVEDVDTAGPASVDSPAVASDQPAEPVKKQEEVSKPETQEEVLESNPVENLPEETPAPPRAEPVSEGVQAQAETTDTQEVLAKYIEQPELNQGGRKVFSALIKGQVYIRGNVDVKEFIDHILGKDPSDPFFERKLLINQSLVRYGITAKGITSFFGSDTDVKLFNLALQNQRKDLGVPQLIQSLNQQALKKKNLNVNLHPELVARESQAMRNALLGLGFKEKEFNLAGRLTSGRAILSDVTKTFLYGNVIQNYFAPLNGKTKANVLNTKENFFDNAEEAAKEHLETEALSKQQLASLTNMGKMVKQFTEKFSEIYQYDHNFKLDSPINYLANSEGELDPNVISNLAMVAYEWIVMDSGQSVLKDKKSIASMLGYADESAIGYALQNKYSDKGDVLSAVYNKLGKSAIRSLGIKATKDAPGNLSTNLAQSLGMHIVATMAEMNMVTFNEMSLEEFINDQSTTGNQKDNLSVDGKNVTFVRASVNRKGELHNTLASIVETEQDSNYLMNDLFKTEKELRMPSYDGVPGIIKKVRGTDKFLSPEQEKVVEKEQERTWKMKEDNLKVFDFLSDEKKLELLGYDPDYQTTQHEVTHESWKSKNLRILNSLKHLAQHRGTLEAKKFAAELEGKEATGEFRMQYSVIKQGRIMMNSNTFNMQSDKIHRHFGKASDWDNSYDIKNGKAEDVFWLAVASGMDLDIDKNLGSKVIAEAQAKYESQEIQDALEIVSVIGSEQEDQSIENQDTLIKAINKINKDEPAYGLDVLIALSKMKEAIESNQSSFDSDLVIEIDGLTNGPAIGMLQFAAAQSMNDLKLKLQRMGMFFDGTEHVVDHVSKEGVLDSYENLAQLWKGEIDNLINDFTAKEKRDYLIIESLIGEIGRKLAKDPLIQTNYGSGKEALEVELKNKVMDSIYDRLTTIAANIKDDPITGKEEYKAFIKQLNTLLPDGQLLSANTDPLSLYLNKAVEANIERVLSYSYAPALDNAIKQEFGVYRETVNEINAAYAGVFKVYEVALSNAIEKRKQEMINEGTLNDKYMDLPEAEIKAIKDQLSFLEPKMKGPMSNNTDNTFIEMVKSGEQQVVDSKAYKTQAKFKKPIKGLNKKNRSLYGRSNTISDPGAAPGVLGVQSIDAATMTEYLNKEGALNIYDAIMVSAKDAISRGTEINKSFIEVNTEFSILDQVVNQYAVTKKYADENGLSKLLMTKDPKQPFNPILLSADEIQKRLSNTTTRANNAKKAALSEMTMSNQYVFTGSEVNPTQVMKDKKDRLSQPKEAPTQQQLDERDELFSDVNNSLEYLRQEALDQREFNKFYDELIDNTFPQDRELGSTGSRIDTENVIADSVKKVDQSNSEDVFDDLGKGSHLTKENSEHQNYLKELLTGSVNKVLEPFKLHLKNTNKMETVGATNNLDMWIFNQVSNTDPKVSRLLGNGIRMSAQEVYLHELVHNITRAGVDQRNAVTRHLESLWEDAKKSIKVEDLMADPNMDKSDADYQREYEAAERRYNHIFNPKLSYGTRTLDESTGLTKQHFQADYLHEFVAFGMTNQRFRKLLGEIKPSIKTEKLSFKVWEGGLAKFPDNLSTLLGQLFNRISAMVGLKAKGALENDVRGQLDELFLQLARIERESKNKVLQGLQEGSDAFLEKGNKLAIAIRRQVSKVTGSPLLRDRGPQLTRAAAGITTHLTGESPEHLGNAVKGYFNTMKQGKQGLAGATVTEIAGRTQDNGKFHNMIRKAKVTIDHQRKNMKSSVSAQLIKAFGSDVSQAEREALTKVFIKTDLETLQDYYKMEGIERLLNDPTALNIEIERHTKHVRTSQIGNFYVNQAKGLGYLMATGLSSLPNQLLNVNRIAKGIGSNQKVSDADAQRMKVYIDRLTSLYALKYTRKSHITLASKVMRQELSRKPGGVNKVGNGIEYMLWQHKFLKEQAQKHIFNSDPDNMIKGYTKEIVNPYKDIRYGTLAEEVEWRQHGYVRQEVAISTDPTDKKREPVYMYVSSNNGLSQFEAGIMSRTGRKAKGTSLTDLARQQGEETTGLKAAARLAKELQVVSKKHDSLARQITHQRHFDPTTVKENFMIPVHDLSGNVTDYRYTMAESTKDNVMEKNNDFSEILGGMAGSIIDKKHTTKVNLEALQALHEQYVEEFDEKHNQYVVIGPDSTDPELKDLWRALPDQTKRDIETVWGSGTRNLLVRNDLVRIVFGQRKVSITDRWDVQDKTMYDRIFIGMVEFFFGTVLRREAPKASMKSVENAWKELVKELKEIIVIKTFVVTFANTLSNAMLLKLMGVPLKGIIRDQFSALEGIQAYKKDRIQLMEQRRLREFSLSKSPNTDVRKFDQQIARLENSLTNNPVSELVDAGVYQTIVEDLGDEKDVYSYKSKGMEQAEEILGSFDKLPDGPKRIMKELFVMKGSSMYQVANEFAQTSDFMARYALHKHFTQRKVNPLSKGKSIETIMEIFINYELPTHEYIQYLNDVGVFWFSKYALRVMKVLFVTMKERPAMLMSLLFLQQMFGDLPDIHDTSLNPLDRVRLPDFSSFTQMGPIQMIDNIIK